MYEVTAIEKSSDSRKLAVTANQFGFKFKNSKL